MPRADERLGHHADSPRDNLGNTFDLGHLLDLPGGLPEEQGLVP